MDAPLTSGDWYYRVDGGMSMAVFGQPESEGDLVLTCQLASRTIEVERNGDAPQTLQMTIRTEAREGNLPARPDHDEIPFLVAAISPTDPLLDAMAFSKGRFAVEVPGLPTLYVPSYPEVTRVIEDCR